MELSELFTVVLCTTIVHSHKHSQMSSSCSCAWACWCIFSCLFWVYLSVPVQVIAWIQTHLQSGMTVIYVSSAMYVVHTKVLCLCLTVC